MIDSETDLTVVTGANVVRVSLTSGAVQLLDALRGTSVADIIRDHRALLTSITVRCVASGRMQNQAITIDADDITEAVCHGYRGSDHTQQSAPRR